VDKCGDLAFVGIKMNAVPFAELLVKVEKGDHVLHRVVYESSVVRVPRVGQLEAARGDFISFIRGA
jgi:hypothetical protein